MNRVVSLLAVTAVICVACVDSQSSSRASSAAPAEKAAVESTTAAFHQTLRTNDSTALYSYIADDVLMMPPGEAPVRGSSAMRSWYAAFLKQYATSSLKLNDKEVFVGNGWATEVGSYEWALKPRAGGAEVLDRGHYMQVWKQMPNGQWKFYREVWNSTSPPG
jgi:ketosteroid isomerase-like protein